MMGEEKNKYDIVAEYEDAQRQHKNYDETTAKEQDQANDRLSACPQKSWQTLTI